MTNRTSAAKGTTAFEFDAVGNLTAINHPASPSVSLAYDALNRVTNMVDAIGTTHYSYSGSAAGRSVTEDGPWESDTVTSVYTNRLRASLALNQPGTNDWVDHCAHDVAKRLARITSPAGTFNYGYALGQTVSPASLVRSLAFPGGAYLTNTYDSVARLRRGQASIFPLISIR